MLHASIASIETLVSLNYYEEFVLFSYMLYVICLVSNTTHKQYYDIRTTHLGVICHGNIYLTLVLSISEMFMHFLTFNRFCDLGPFFKSLNLLLTIRFFVK